MEVNKEQEELKRHREIDRGNRATAILDNELFQEAIQSLRDTYKNAWEQSSMKDSDSRERVWALLRGLNDMEQHFKSLVTTGEMSKKQVAEILEKDEGLLDEKTLRIWGVYQPQEKEQHA